MQANGVTDLTPGVDDSSWAFGINDLNQVVGGASLDGGSTFPFLYQDGTLYDLANLLDCSDSGWTNLTPESINDLGQIAGYGTFDGQTEAFLLTPTGDGSFSASGVPEPASLTLLAFGSMLFPWRRKRGRHFGRS
jgi:probable HAF family extracellular repeat protein